MTNELRRMEFFVVRYVLGMSGQINIGVVVLERQEGRVCFARARFVQDMQRVLAFDPDADVDMLRSFFRDIERRLDDPEDREEILHLMRDTFSNMLQVSDDEPVLISGEPEAEVDRLASLYLFSQPSKSLR